MIDEGLLPTEKSSCIDLDYHVELFQLTTDGGHLEFQDGGLKSQFYIPVVRLVNVTCPDGSTLS
jgi:hypothetical protein